MHIKIFFLLIIYNPTSAQAACGLKQAFFSYHHLVKKNMSVDDLYKKYYVFWGKQISSVETKEEKQSKICKTTIATYEILKSERKLTNPFITKKTECHNKDSKFKFGGSGCYPSTNHFGKSTAMFFFKVNSLNINDSTMDYHLSFPSQKLLTFNEMKKGYKHHQYQENFKYRHFKNHNHKSFADSPEYYTVIPKKQTFGLSLDTDLTKIKNWGDINLSKNFVASLEKAFKEVDLCFENNKRQENIDKLKVQITGQLNNGVITEFDMTPNDPAFNTRYARYLNDKKESDKQVKKLKKAGNYTSVKNKSRFSRLELRVKDGFDCFKSKMLGKSFPDQVKNSKFNLSYTLVNTR